MADSDEFDSFDLIEEAQESGFIMAVWAVCSGCAQDMLADLPSVAQGGLIYCQDCAKKPVCGCDELDYRDCEIDCRIGAKASQVAP